MKVKKKFASIIGLLLCAVMIVSLVPVAQAQTYSLTIQSPKAEVEKIPITPLAERLETFHGMKIAFFPISLNPYLQTTLPALFTERFGASGTNDFGVTFGATNAKSTVQHTEIFTAYESMARVADAVIVGTAF